MTNRRGYTVSEAEGMRQAWQDRRNVQVYTSNKSGKLSADGKRANGKTWAMTPKNDDGTYVMNSNGEARQSGRSQIATRRQRDYDNRKAMNHITQRTVDAWRKLGWIQEVDGNMVGRNGNIIRQLPDGNYSMGLTTG